MHISLLLAKSSLMLMTSDYYPKRKMRERKKERRMGEVDARENR